MRHDVLADTSTGNTLFSPDGCQVRHGRWYDPYTDKTFSNPRDLDIDHIVPLSYAWHHGADTWPQQKRESFANDPANLIAVQAGANRQKSDSGPLKWLPDNVAHRCAYLLRFERIARAYGLRFAPAEQTDMTNLRAYTC